MINVICRFFQEEKTKYISCVGPVVEVVAITSLCVLGCRGLDIVGTQNVSFTDTGLRFDERKLVESTVSTLYGIALVTSNAS